MELATAFVSFKPKVAGFKEETVKQAKDAGTAAGTEGGKALKQGFDRSSKGVGVEAYNGLKNLFVGGAVVAGINNIIQKASDLNESVSKAGVIFGDASKDIITFADNAAKSLGQSKQAAIDAASTFATFGKAAGLSGTDLSNFAKEADTLASDLASFFNTRPEDAVQAIGAAFRGESEPIRAYGVLLDEATLKNQALKDGLITSTKEALLPQQKVIAAYHAILAQTSDAQGDFARTADGAANKQRILAAEAENARAKLGTQLLPIYNELLGAVTTLVGAFSALPEPIQLSIVALAAFAALRGPVSNVLAVVKGLGPALIGAHPAVIGLVAAIGALAIVLSDSGEILDDSQAAFSGFAKAAGDLGKNVASAFSDLEKQALGTDHLVGALSQLGLTVEDVQRMLASGLTPGDIVGQLEAVGDTSDETQEAIATLGTALTDLGWSENIAGAAQLNGALKTLGQDALVQAAKDAGATDDALAAFAHQLYLGSLNATILSQTGIPLAGTLENVRQKLAEAKDAAKDAGADLSVLSDDSSILSDSTDRLAFSLGGAATAASNLKTALDEVFGPAQTLADAEQALFENADALTEAIDKNGKTLDINTEAGRKNRDAIDASVKGYEDYAVALVNSGASTDEATNKLNFYIAALRQQLIDSGLSEQAVDEYIGSLNLTPENVTTAINLANRAQAEAEVKTWLSNVNPVSKGGTIPDEVISAVKALMDRGSVNEAKGLIHDVETNGGKGYAATINLIAVGQQAIRNIISSLTGGAIPDHASGGVVRRPTLSTLAERGPEVVLNADQAVNTLWAVANTPPSTQSTDLSSSTSSTSVGGSGAQVDARLIINGDVYGVDDLDRWADERDRRLAFALGAR